MNILKFYINKNKYNLKTRLFLIYIWLVVRLIRFSFYRLKSNIRKSLNKKEYSRFDVIKLALNHACLDDFKNYNKYEITEYETKPYLYICHKIIDDVKHYINISIQEAKGEGSFWRFIDGGTTYGFDSNINNTDFNKYESSDIEYKEMDISDEFKKNVEKHINRIESNRSRGYFDKKYYRVPDIKEFVLGFEFYVWHAGEMEWNKKKITKKYFLEDNDYQLDYYIPMKINKSEIITKVWEKEY